MRCVLLAAAVAALMLVVADARAECLRNSEPLTGELREIRTTDSTGQPLSSFHVVLQTPVCIEIEQTADAEAGEPQVIEDVRSVELVLAIPAESLEFGELLGAEVEVSGRFEAPVETVHTGDAVLIDAAVTTIEGARRPKGEDIEPDDALEARIERFVRGFYLSGQDVGEEQIRLLYAPFVHYFGKDDVSIAQIIRDKTAYYRRWPQRVFSLIEGTLDVRRLEGNGNVYDVAFEYDFEVRRGGDQKRGRGVAVLTIDLNEDEGRIVRETGRVLKRL